MHALHATIDTPHPTPIHLQVVDQLPRREEGGGHRDGHEGEAPPPQAPHLVLLGRSEPVVLVHQLGAHQQSGAVVSAGPQVAADLAQVAIRKRGEPPPSVGGQKAKGYLNLLHCARGTRDA